MATEDRKKGLARLREPFPKHQINKLPPHGLEYVGHAALTDRLLEVDPEWNWEPVAWDLAGQPMLDEHGGMWIRLTVCGVTRLGYGDGGKMRGGNAWKERIGDALRNAGMRFGLALDLWHKGDLHETQEARGSNGEPEAEPAKKRTKVPQKREDVVAEFGTHQGKALPQWPWEYVVNTLNVIQARLNAKPKDRTLQKMVVLLFDELKLRYGQAEGDERAMLWDSIHRDIQKRGEEPVGIHLQALVGEDN